MWKQGRMIRKRAALDLGMQMCGANRTSRTSQLLDLIVSVTGFAEAVPAGATAT